jgi:NADH:ubiquinone oxidoreductase subunit 5 (subunit L)/multisubunit Na+/H+ antiporter MnhA subunit
VAAVLLSLAHAAAKTALFLSAGSILHATGQRNLDRLGGLWMGLPTTCTVFGVAALGAAGLPVSAGFVAEWALLQALIHAGPSADPLVAVTTAVTVTVVALTAGLALLTFTKAFGIAFLGRARSVEASAAQEVGVLERVAGIAAAVVVVALGVVPGPVARWVASALYPAAPAAATTPPVTGPVTTAGTTWGTGLALPGLPGALGRAVAPVLDPVGLAGLAVVLTVLGLVVSARLRRRVPRRAVDLAWGCGGARVSPRMQYTATSYAEPLVRVFDGVLAVTRTVETRSVAGDPYLEQEVRFGQRLTDMVERRLYDPVVALAVRIGDAARTVQNGSINRYLLFSFGALLTVLVAVTR